jgi:hypothetical protein
MAGNKSEIWAGKIYIRLVKYRVENSSKTKDKNTYKYIR